MDAASQYMERLKEALKVDNERNTNFLNDMRASVLDYSEGKEITYEELVNRFGEPDLVAETYFENCSISPYDLLKKKHNEVRSIRNMVLLFVVLAFLLVLIFWLILYFQDTTIVQI